jgi:hypothetical protein
MLSIQQAEKKLEQNDQNIEIFEELRNTLKPKKGKSQAQAKNESVRSEHNESEKGESMPQLSKPGCMQINRRLTGTTAKNMRGTRSCRSHKAR